MWAEDRPAGARVGGEVEVFGEEQLVVEPCAGRGAQGAAGFAVTAQDQGLTKFGSAAG